MDKGSASASLLPGDSDTWTVSLDAGQVLWFGIDAHSSLVPRAEFYGPGGQLVAAVFGQTTNENLSLPPVIGTEAGEYRLVVSGLVFGLSGGYFVEWAINGVDALGVTNTSLATATNVNELLVTLAPAQGDSPAVRTAVVMHGFNPALADRSYYRIDLDAGDMLNAFTYSNSGNHLISLLAADGTDILHGGFFTNGSDLRGIGDFVATATGSYYIRVIGVIDEMAIGVNHTFAASRQAISPLYAATIGPSGRVLARMDSGDTATYHLLTLAAGEEVTLTTSTPFDAPNVFVNNLNPRLEVLDAAGVIHASDADSAPDGRNASLTFTAPAAGTYTIRVTRQFATTGTYLLTASDPAGDAVAPRIVRVIVDGSDWSPAFRAHLTSTGAGVGNGYALPAGSADQSLPLPWTNVNRLRVQFSEHVDVTGADLSLWGVATADYAAALAGGFSYDAATFTATWALPSSLPAEKLRMILADRVADAAGNALDGDWTDGLSLQSGNGSAGGDFVYRLNILPGDVNRSAGVAINDAILVRNAQFTSPGNPAYSALLDVNGSGEINAQDVILVRDQQFTSLPIGEPPSPAVVIPQVIEPPPLIPLEKSPSSARKRATEPTPDLLYAAAQSLASSRPSRAPLAPVMPAVTSTKLPALLGNVTPLWTLRSLQKALEL